MGRITGSKNRSTIEREALLEQGLLSCYGCGEVLDCTEFSKNSRAPAGYEYKCRTCMAYSARVRARSKYRESNPVTPGEPGTYEWNEAMKVLAAEGKSRCTECRGDFPVGEFYWNRGRPSPKCKECHKGAARRNRIEAQYGLSVSDYEALVTSPCAICETTDRVRVVDHDHTTGTVRGALCDRCNVSLGHFMDDPALLRAAADYLERHHSKRVLLVDPT